MCVFKQINAYRHYNPSTGRFLSQDPIGFRGGDTNMYRYVWNNPIIMTDPYGEMGVGAILGVGIGAAYYFFGSELSNQNYDDHKQTNGPLYWENYKRRKELENYITPKDPNDPLKDLKKNFPRQCNEMG